MGCMLQSSGEELLLENGFEADESGVFTRECDGYTLSVALGEERTAAGRIETAEITALYQGGELFSLPDARYVSEEVAR